jgi:cell division protein FtsB
MPQTEATEPPDATPRPTSTSPSLDAVPAFLRHRAERPGEAAARRVVQLGTPAPAPDPTTLPFATIAPRKLVAVGAGVLLVWLLLSFGRQVAEASAASTRADQLRDANTAMAQEVNALQRELNTIQEQRYIELAARAYRLGSPNEIPFALEANAPALPANAPGSATSAIGADEVTASPLEHWLEILFGPGA